MIPFFRSAASTPRALPLVLVAVAALATPSRAQEPAASDGPVIHGYGAVWDIPGPDLATPLDRDLRVVFEVAQSSEHPGDVNPWLNTVARFLNMHARAAVPRDRMHVAVVIHGEAAKDALDAELFRSRYGTENRNESLLRQLSAAGVELYLCGQSAMSRDLPRDRLQPYMRVALSAMTAIAVLKGRGYVTVN
jgi:intracellular sulfur oxidation DsrE/DsrF family protein